MLGAPLSTLTLLHHAEELARVEPKKLVHYSCPVKTASGVEWMEIDDIDTSLGAFPYQQVVGDRDGFEVIAEEALAAGVGVTGRVGESNSHLFPLGESAMHSRSPGWRNTSPDAYGGHASCGCPKLSLVRLPYRRFAR